MMRQQSEVAPVCLASHEPGGPKRCSGDTRTRLASSTTAAIALANQETFLLRALDGTATQAGPGPGDAIRDRYQAHAATGGKIGAAVRFARDVLQEGRAVIIDTETTSMNGSICEIAIIDAHSGQPLLNTLVNPGEPILPAAHAVHGISNDEATAPGVPTWAQVYRDFEQATRGRVILAYNADYDREVIAADCRRHGLDGAHVCDTGWWADVMVPRSDYAGSRRWLRNDGGHRALGDVLQTRQHLLAMANGWATTVRDASFAVDQTSG